MNLTSFTVDHPAYPLGAESIDFYIEGLQSGDPEVISLLQAREDLIQLEKEDPYHGIYVLDSWKLAEEQFNVPGIDELLILGGNRSSKSTYAAWKVMKTLVENPKSVAWCFHTNRVNSTSMQQPLIWQFFPKKWKYNHQSRVHSVRYSQKGGFTEATFVLPNGSQCFFKNYEQDRDVIEGGMVDIIWCDELVPFDWIETLRYRIMDKSGKLLTCFTPVDGYSSTVKMYLQGARTLKKIRADLLKNEYVPVVQQPVYRKSRVVYFHSSHNIFFPYDNLKRTLEGKSRTDILCRAYGVPVKARTARFPLFNELIHVLPPSQLPTNDKQKTSNWLFIDPCPGRNWFMIWVAVDVLSRKYVYREWPCQAISIPGIGNLGPWAEPDGKKSDGKKGQAQESLGLGVDAYLEEIRRLEKEPVIARYMDSRAASTPMYSKTGQTTLLAECSRAGMPFMPTLGREIEEGIDLINTLLYYDREKPIDYTNAPQLYISEECQNIIYSLKEWTGEDGKTGACKDPIDCLRYMVLTNPFYIDENEPVCSPGGYY